MGQTFEEHDKILDKHAVLLEYLVVLDENNFENYLSIRIMPTKVKDDWIHGNAFLKPSNPMILKETSEHVRTEEDYLLLTVNVLSWLRYQEVNHHDITMSEVKVMFKSYKGTGFGCRNTVKYVGFVNFQGIKNEGKRAMPSPVTGP
eukprot:7569745-Ditylum_brightwellii.AAC.1